MMAAVPFLLAWAATGGGGTIGLSIDRFLAYGPQLSFKTFRPFIPIVPCPVGERHHAVSNMLARCRADLRSLSQLALEFDFCLRLRGRNRSTRVRHRFMRFAFSSAAWNASEAVLPCPNWQNSFHRGH